jgi:hypothetical protein
LDLAPSDSQFLLKGKYFKKWSVGGRSGYQETAWETKITWNEIIGLLGPELFQPRDEDSANTQLGISIAARLGLGGHSVKVDRETFNTMKLQLMSLGFIEIKSLATTKGGVAVFWSLTPRGSEVMLRMRTIKSDPEK